MFYKLKLFCLNIDRIFLKKYLTNFYLNAIRMCKFVIFILGLPVRFLI